MSAKLTNETKEADAAAVTSDSDEEEAALLQNELEENEKKTDEQKRRFEELEKEYAAEKSDTPLRFLALPPLHKSTKISLADFDRLRAAAIADDTITGIPRRKHETSSAEIIVRACHLLFALVESGGLGAGAPEREIARLRINVAEACYGMLQPVSARAPNQKTENSKAAEDGLAVVGDDLNSATSAAEVEMMPLLNQGLRQPLYALGRFHLNSFIRLRVNKQKAQGDGESRLLPELKISGAELKEIVVSLPWLESLPNKSKITWESVFRHWLRQHLLILCNKTEKVNWSDVARLAAWRVLPRERYPFLIAARRRLFQSVPLTEAKIESIFALEAPVFSKTSRAPFEAFGDSATAPDKENDSLYLSASEQNLFGEFDDDDEDDPEDKIISRQSQRLDKSAPESNYKHASGILSLLRARNAKKTDLRKSLLVWADDEILSGSGENDLRNLLRWSGSVLEQSEISTAQTYGDKVLRALYAMPHAPFAEWTTEDVAEYLENYSTAASVNIVRSSLQQFDKYLIKENLADENHVAWNSRLLKAPATYSARDVLSNDEYTKVREMITASADEESLKLRQLCLLTLLRRCGLRVGEAEWLTPRNFMRGYSKWALEITHSKTRAGLRKLPLFLLLDEQEIYEMRQFVRLQTNKTQQTLFLDARGNPSTAHALGREAEKLLRRAGIEGETAHGLRHAFANSLFASFWLNLTDARAPEGRSNPARRAFKQYTRQEIEGRAVLREPVLIQQLLGHSDLRVTFERYIHLLELAGADAVWLYENDAATTDFINVKVAANILGMDEKLFRREVGSLTNGAASLFEVAQLSLSRLP